MENNHLEVDHYLSQLNGHEKEWTTLFVSYMREKYPHLEEVISFKVPTYRLGSGKARNYIAFGFGKSHFSLHSMDFEYIAELKCLLSKPGKGKGCVNVPFTQTDEQRILFKAIDCIIKRNVTHVYGKSQ